MTLSSDQATESLKEIHRTGRRSRQAYGYANSSPFFVLWGVIWMIGYTGTDLYPRHANLLWAALMVAGVLGTIVIGRARAQAGDPHPGINHHAGWRFLATWVAVGVFIAATFTIFGHASHEQQAAFTPLIVALIYSVAGIWLGVRFLVTGIAVAALTLGGYFFLHEHFMLWMAAVGGGALVLAGLWLRTV
ncbi:MAG TPA: hypothetical protein VHX18_11980 [Rhizomicrobium sp.]|jgi:hypothetical protein|nr:hypothetical protein [Rhizomicrobium sp.]